MASALSQCAAGYHHPMHAGGSETAESSSLALPRAHPPRLSLAAGSWVLIYNPDGLPIIGQIEQAYQDQQHDWQLSITRFLRAEETWHGPSKTFWPNEVFKTNMTSTHSIRQVIAPAFAMSPSQFRIGTPKQPIWSPQTPLFLVEAKYSVNPAGPAHPSHSSRPFSKLSNWKNLVTSCLDLRSEPLALEKQPSPFLSPRGRDSQNTIGGLLSADSDSSTTQGTLKRSLSDDASSQLGSSPDTKKSRRSPPPPNAVNFPSRPAPPSFTAPPARDHSPFTPAASASEAVRPSLPHSSSVQTLTPLTTQQQTNQPATTTQQNFSSEEYICGVKRFNPWQGTQHEKPPFTYASLVAQAIYHSPDKRATLDQIYRFVIEQYPWYEHEDARSWHNSIRHNLSLRKCFVKTERDGKGAYWSLAVPDGSDESFDGTNFSTGKARRNPSISSTSGGHRRTSGGSISSTTTGVSSLFDSISDVSSFSAASAATPPFLSQPYLDKDQVLPPSLTGSAPLAPPPLPAQSHAAATAAEEADPPAIDPAASAAAAFEVSDAAKSFLAQYQGQSERPPFTFAALCAQAITQSPTGAPSLAEIYEYIQDHYPFFQKNQKGWQNSVRHNLSLKACFIKITRPSNSFRRTTRQGATVKGGCWTVGAAELSKFDGAQFAKESSGGGGGSQRAMSVASSSRSRATSVALSEVDGQSEANTSGSSSRRSLGGSQDASPSALDLLSLACQQQVD